MMAVAQPKNESFAEHPWSLDSSVSLFWMSGQQSNASLAKFQVILCCGEWPQNILASSDFSGHRDVALSGSYLEFSVIPDT